MDPGLRTEYMSLLRPMLPEFEQQLGITLFAPHLCHFRADTRILFRSRDAAPRFHGRPDGSRYQTL